MAKVEHFAKFADERMEKEVETAKGGKEGGGAEGEGGEWAAKRMAAAKLMPNPLAVGAASATHV